MPTQVTFQILVCSKANRQQIGCIDQPALAVCKPLSLHTPKDEHVIERKLSPDRSRALHVTKAQIGVESGKDDLLGLSFQPDGGRTEAGQLSLGDRAWEEKVFPNHSDDRRERHWARSDECMVLSFSLGPWCRSQLEPCSSANFHSARMLLRMNSTRSCFDAVCMVHLCAFIKGYGDPVLPSQGAET